MGKFRDLTGMQFGTDPYKKTKGVYMNNFEKVSSSYIDSIGYDPGNQELFVKFNNGVIWKYFDVPESAHVSLLLAESIGKFFAKEIKGVFTGRKVEPKDAQ